MVIIWNTGAHYTGEGQVIIAKLMPDRTAYFLDACRGVDGTIPTEFCGMQNEGNGRRREFRQWVLVAYDKGYYKGGTRDYKLRNDMAKLAQARIDAGPVEANAWEVEELQEG